MGNKIGRHLRIYEAKQKKIKREQINIMKNPNTQYLFLIRTPDNFLRVKFLPSLRIGKKYVKSTYGLNVYAEIWHLIKVNGCYKKSFLTKKYQDSRKYTMDEKFYDGGTK